MWLDPSLIFPIMSEPDSIRLHSREPIRTGRYAVIGAGPADARRVWFALHGYGQLATSFVRPLLAGVKVFLVAGDADPLLLPGAFVRLERQLGKWTPDVGVRPYSGDHYLEPVTLFALLQELYGEGDREGEGEGDA